VPEHTGFIFNNTEVNRDVGSVVLAKRSGTPVPRGVEHLPQLDEAREAPIAFFLGEAMVGMVECV